MGTIILAGSFLRTKLLLAGTKNATLRLTDENCYLRELAIVQGKENKNSSNWNLTFMSSEIDDRSMEKKVTGYRLKHEQFAIENSLINAFRSLTRDPGTKVTIYYVCPVMCSWAKCVLKSMLPLVTYKNWDYGFLPSQITCNGLSLLNMCKEPPSRVVTREIQDIIMNNEKNYKRDETRGVVEAIVACLYVPNDNKEDNPYQLAIAVRAKGWKLEGQLNEEEGGNLKLKFVNRVNELERKYGKFSTVYTADVPMAKWIKSCITDSLVQILPVFTRPLNVYERRLRISIDPNCLLHFTTGYWCKSVLHFLLLLIGKCNRMKWAIKN